MSAQKDERLKQEGGGSSIALANCAPGLLPTSSSLQSKCPTVVATNLFSTACIPGPCGPEVVTGSDAASKSFGCLLRMLRFGCLSTLGFTRLLGKMKK